MSNRLRQPSPATLIALAALVISIMGQPFANAASSFVATLDGHQIKPRSMPGDRVKSKSLPGSALKDHSVGAEKLKARTIRARHVGANVLTGAEIAEFRLGQVPEAKHAEDATTLGGVPASALSIGRSGHSATCDPASSAFAECVTATVGFPRAGRPFVISEFDWHADTVPASGVCKLTIDGAGVPGVEAHPGESSSSTDTTRNKHSGITAVGPVIDSGVHEFAISCNEQEGDIEFEQLHVSALLLGTD